MTTGVLLAFGLILAPLLLYVVARLLVNLALLLWRLLRRQSKPARMPPAPAGATGRAQGDFTA
jgi:hypothetical protein